MKIRLLPVILLGILFFIYCGAGDDSPVLKGSYLGQKPPGRTPVMFAPGIVSTKDKYELNSIFSPDGNEFYYEISTTTPEEKKLGKYFYIIMVSKQIDGIWTKPELASFSGKYMTVDMCFSPDGNRLYFCSDRQDPWGAANKMHIWYVDRTDSGWSEAKILGPPIYSEKGDSQLSLAKNGNMYYRIGDDLYFSKYENEEFTEPVRLGDEINSPYSESKPFVAPDESYLLFVRYEMPESINGGKGLYISIKNEDGSWTPAKITNINGSLPKLTPDLKYFFFSREGDIYWVDASVLDEWK